MSKDRYYCEACGWYFSKPVEIEYVDNEWAECCPNCESPSGWYERDDWEGKKDYLPVFEAMTRVMINTFKKKNHDYGNSFEEHGVVGVMLRMHDKFKRFLSVSEKGINLVNDEGLDDTLLDLAIYSVMALILRPAFKDTDDSKWIDHVLKGNAPS